MLEVIQGALGDNDFWVFVLLTLLMGGGAAWRTGQAVAESWGSLWPVAAYMLLLAAAVRFLHYALFSGPLFSLPHFAIDYCVLLVLALMGHRVRRTRHMSEQYPWLVERGGVLGWRLRKS
jgi:hypothetical protein